VEKVCLASKVVHDRTPEEVVRIAAAAGYGGVEWFCLPQHLPPDTPRATVRHLGDLTRDLGLGTACLSTYVGGFADLSDEACLHQVALFARYVDLAQELDCPLLRIWPDDMGRRLREPVSEAQLARVATYLGLAADRAAQGGRRVAVEMHQTIGVDADLLLRLLELVGRPNVGVIYDPGNLYLARRPYGVEALRRFAGDASRPSLILHAQLKDATLRRPTPPHLADEPALRFGGDFDLLMGQGEVDLQGAVDGLRAVGYSGWLSVETHALPRPGLESATIAATELRAVRRFIRAPVQRKRGHWSDE
jgi:sugar phosphate isomerase/epimerase